MLAVPMSFGSATALPFAIVSCLVTVYAGYRIWRAAHPSTSFRQEFSRRTVAVITFGATVGAMLFALAIPQVALVIIGVWVAAIAALFAMLALAERMSRSADD